MASLPEDIQSDILSRLPVKTLMRFKSVCKPWCSLFRTPYFIKKHLHYVIRKKSFFLMLHHGWRDSLLSIQYSSLSSKLSPSSCNPLKMIVKMDYPSVSPPNRVCLSGSYNGLVCLKIGEPPDCTCSILLWNPSTMEYKRIPDSPNHLVGGDRDATLCGLGYDNAIEDFKLVKVRFIDYHSSTDNSSSGSDSDMYEASTDDNSTGSDSEMYEAEVPSDFSLETSSYMSEIEVYTLGSNSWKTCGMMPYYFPGALSSGVVVNGNLHWWAVNILDGYEAIVYFDMTNEVFKEVTILDGPLLHPIAYYDKYSNALGALGGCICLLHTTYGVKIDVWVMQEYGVKESWTKCFTITATSITKALGLILVCDFENGYMLFKTSECYVYYDPNRRRDIPLSIDAREVPGVVKYLPSLESLKSGTYVEKQTDKENSRDT